MLIVNAEQVMPQPWRNGGGRTRELLARPAGAAWTVRVSLADIESDGPFSAFDGVERWFAVVQGAGVRLRFDVSERRVRAGDAPIRFDGAQAPGCTLIDGPTRDLNLMVRGGVGAMLPVQAGLACSERLGERGLFTLCAGHWHAGPGAALRVEAHTLLWDLPDLSGSFVPASPGPCGWWLGCTGGGP